MIEISKMKRCDKGTFLDFKWLKPLEKESKSDINKELIRNKCLNMFLKKISFYLFSFVLIFGVEYISVIISAYSYILNKT